MTAHGLATCIATALRELCATVSATDARTVVFGALVIARARNTGRLSVTYPLDRALCDYALAPLPSLAPTNFARIVEAFGSTSVSSDEMIALYEHSLAREHDARHSTGAYFTPRPIADGLLDLALAPLLASMHSPRVCDPSCGAGVFLLGALHRIATMRANVTHESFETALSYVATSCVHGIDRDRAAVELARALVWTETALPWTSLGDLQGFRCADALLDEPFARDPAFDLVVGNPPFLNQLEDGSARTVALREGLRARFGDAAGGYADTAVAFLLTALESVSPGGRVALILPLSVLATRDAERARRYVARTASLESMWLATEHVFAGASVFVCAPVLVRDGARDAVVARRFGAAFTVLPSIAADMDALAVARTWSPLVADALGIPAVHLTGTRTFGDVATVTADFRDQYYGLRGCVVESHRLAPELAHTSPPLVTTGLVDLAHCHWGTRATRFDGTRWTAPRVDLARLASTTVHAAWARARLVPKVLLASQTRVLETVVDERGAWLPCTPLVSIVPRDTHAPDALTLWHLAAALASPPVTAFAAAQYAGTALTINALKLSAAQVRALPLPPACDAWDEAAAHFRLAQSLALAPDGRDASGERREALPREQREALLACARAMCAAYGLSPDEAGITLAWWIPRVFAPTRAVRSLRALPGNPAEGSESAREKLASRR